MYGTCIIIQFSQVSWQKMLQSSLVDLDGVITMVVMDFWQVDNLVLRLKALVVCDGNLFCIEATSFLVLRCVPSS